MKPCLIDSGFLYALVDETDEHSQSVKNALREIYEDVILLVPAVTEAAYFVSKKYGRGGVGGFC